MGALRGEHGNATLHPPPEIEKMLYNSDVISQGSIFSNNYSRNNRKIIFSIEFSSINLKILLKFSQPFVFSSKPAKIESKNLKNFEKYSKII